MPMRIVALLVGLILALDGSISVAAPTGVQVEALFSGTAVLKIDGERKMLKAGQSYKGVTLIAAQPDSATVRVNGEEQILGLSRHIGAQYNAPEEKVVTIARDRRQQYLTNALIDGRSTLVLVDTGANTVAMSSEAADSMGISYLDGMPARVETASGMSNAYAINLRIVDVGGIVVHNVRALVVEGGYPTTVLLGMTYLKHVKMEEQEGILSLSRSH